MVCRQCIATVLLVLLAGTCAPADVNIQITSPTSEGNYVTHHHLLDASGTSNITALPHLYVPIGDEVVSADLSHATDLQDGDVISVDVTTAAEWATLFSSDLGTNDTTPIGQDIQFTLQGTTYQFSAQHTPAGIADAINQDTAQTGVIALCDGTGVIQLLSVELGSDQCIAITGSSGGFTPGDLPMDDCGVDGRAEVINGRTGSKVSDTQWASGSGATLRDSLGNTIILSSDAATRVGRLDTTILVCPDNTEYVTWLNERTGATGACEGATAWQVQDIPLLPGQNMIEVTARSLAGESSTDELLVTLEPSCSSLAAVKQLADDSPFSVAGVVVTADSDDLGSPGRCYVESPDRTCGIWLEQTPAARGDKLWLDGVMSTVNGERRLTADTVSVLGNAPVAPLGMGNAALVSALDTTGLLVTSWGSVKAAEGTLLVIDDGSGEDIRCVLPQGTTADPSWQYVRVTGISSIDGSDSSTRVLRLRGLADVLPL